MAERLFRMLSLVFLTIGVVVGIASADRNSDPSLQNSKDLIYHVKGLQEAEEINNMRMVPVYVVQQDPAKDQALAQAPSPEEQEANQKGLSTQLPAKKK